MKNSSIIVQNEIGINMPYQDLIDNQEDLYFYQELLISILDDWSLGENINLPERSALWKKLFVEINQFIFDPDTDSINFNRCLACGALIFTLNSSKVYIFCNPVIVQMLFQLLPKSPSYQLITKKLWQVSQFKPKHICIINDFQKFLSDLSGKFPESNCLVGWSLHELKYDMDDIYFLKSELMPQFFISDEKVLDAIIDDSDNVFSNLVLHLEEECHDINKFFYLSNYKLPKILSDFPSLASVCCFFNAEKCFLALCEHITDGLISKKMKKIDGKSRSLIHFASAGGNVSIISMLLKSGYSINQTDDENNTPLYYSAMCNNIATFQYLFLNGANILFTNYDSCVSIIHAACFFGSQNIIEFLDIKINLDEFIKNDIIKSKKNNCLSLSCSCGNCCTVDFILTKIISFKDHIKNINEILFISIQNACQNGSLDCIKSILNYNNDFVRVIKKKKKITLLYDIASSNGYQDIIHFLSQYDSSNLLGSIMPFPQIKEYLSTKQKEIQHDNLNNIFYKHASILESFIEDFGIEVSKCQSLNELEINLDIFLELENFYEIWSFYFSDNDIQIKIIKSLYHTLKLSLNQMKIVIDKAHDSIYKLKINEKMKLMRETKKANKYKKDYENMKKINNIYKFKLQDLNTQLESVKVHLRNVFNKNQKALNLINEIDDNKTAGPPILSDFLLQELVGLNKKVKHSRRYSKTIKDISFILFSYSPVAYRMLTGFFPLPSEKTIRDTFKNEIRETKSNLLNMQQLDIIFKKLHRLYTDDDNEKIQAILSADIATMNPKNTGKSGFVAYGFQPSNPRYKMKIIHVKNAVNSRFQQEDIEKFHDIINVGKKYNFDIQMITTDADPKTNKIHTDFFNFLNNFKGTFEQKIERMKEYDKEFPNSDLLHLLKAMRRDFNSNCIKMTNYSPLIIKEKEIELLKKSPFFKEEVIKSSSLTQMRDDLALLLFNTYNLHMLGMNGHSQFYVFQFILVILLTSIQSSKLTCKARIELCKVNYLTLTFFKRFTENWQRCKINDINIANFFDNNNYHRIINNLFCYSYAFKYFSNEISTVNLSSHPLELKFGEIRQGSRGDDTANNALYIISKSLIREELLSNYGKNTSPVRGRSNIGGSKSSDGWNLDLPPSIILEKIPIELYHFCNNWLTPQQFFETNCWKLTCFLNDCTPTIIPNLSGVNTGSRIISRLHNLENKTQQ